MANILGIDLGTSYSSIAVGTPQGVMVLADDAGRTTQPTLVAYRAGQEPLVGHAARPFLVQDPVNTVYGFKRLMGRRMGTPDVRVVCAACPFRVEEGPGGQAIILAGGRPMAVPQVAADVLRQLKRQAETRLNREVRDVCITVPANFDDVQREATDMACRLARLNVRRILNEPTAAAMAFGYGFDVRGRIAVYDFGGGTFDFTVLEAGPSMLRVLATGGDAFLGGEDIDLELARAVARGFRQQHHVDLQRDVVSWQRLLLACEEAKRSLSQHTSVPLRLADMWSGPTGPVGVDTTVTRAMVEAASAEFIARTLQVCEDVVRDAGVRRESLDAVVLVGGTTLMPAVRAAVQQFFGRAPDTRADPLTAVATGAAIQGLILEGARAGTPLARAPALLLDVASHSVGVEGAGHGFVPLIARNTPIPCEQVRTIFPTLQSGGVYTLRVFQGESADVRQNTLVGELVLGQMPPGPEPVAVEVTLELDVGGRLHVSARHPHSGRVFMARLRLAQNNGLLGGAS